MMILESGHEREPQLSMRTLDPRWCCESNSETPYTEAVQRLAADCVLGMQPCDTFL